MPEFTLAQAGFNPSPNPVQPAEGAAPYTKFSWLPEGSTLATDLSLGTTPLVKKDITYNIIEAWRQQFKLMRILYENDIHYHNSFAYDVPEEPWDRTPVTITANNAGGSQTQTISVTDSSNIAPQAMFFYPDGINMGIVTSVTNSTTIVVRAKDGGTCPSITAGDYLTIGAYGKGDGSNYLTGYSRGAVNMKRYLIGRIERSQRYTEDELLELRNNGTTDYYERDLSRMMRLIKQDAFAMYLYGKEGVFSFTNPTASVAYKIVSGDGFLTQLIKGQAASCTSTTASFLADFETLSDNTNLRGEDEPRFLVGTNRTINLVSKIWKNPVLYNPSDTIASLNLSQYTIGTQKFVPISLELMRKSSFLFPPNVENILMCLDMNFIHPTCINGAEPFMFRGVLPNLKQGNGYNDFEESTVSARVGAEVNVLDAHFYMTLQG